MPSMNDHDDTLLYEISRYWRLELKTGGCLSDALRPTDEMLLPLRCRLRSEVRAVRLVMSDREVKLLNSRCRVTRPDAKFESGMSDRRDNWFVLAKSAEREGKLVAIWQMSSQLSRVSSNASSLTFLKVFSASLREPSPSTSWKRLPL